MAELAEPRRPTEPRCPPCTPLAATAASAASAAPDATAASAASAAPDATAATTATAVTATMASPTVLTFDAEGRAVNFDLWVDDCWCNPTVCIRLVVRVRACVSAVAVVLERQMAALRIEEDEAVEEGVQKFFDLLTRLEGADLNYSELQKKTKLLALLPESWSSLIINLNRDLPRLSLEDVKRAILQEDFRRRELSSADGAGAASIGRGRGRGRGGSRFGSNNFNGSRGSSGYGNDNNNNGRGGGRFDGECHYCHKSGHMWRDCFKLPDGWTLAQGQEGRGAGGGRGRGRGGRGGRRGGAASMRSAGNESESRDDRFPGQFFFVSMQAPAGPEKDEGFKEQPAVGKATLHSLDYWVIDSGATYNMTPRADLLTELEPSPVKHVTSALGQRAEVKFMGKAMFKGADGKMVGLKNVLWVPNLAANLISVRRLQKAGMDMSSKGAKTYTARLGERILWDLHEDRDVYNEMWQIPVVPMPKERQVAASISTKGEAVGSADSANGRTKEIESKKCNLGGTSKLGEHKESGAAAKEQHKGEENLKAVAEEEYGENMWGTIASAAFSNPTLATGECDWLTLHRRMGHVALPILQQLVKNEMVAGIRVKGEPDEVLGCPTCMQAKFTRFSFSSSEATAKAPLNEVVMDVVGLVKLGAAGAEYFLTIVDIYSRMTWVYVLSKKSDMAETVKTDWLPMVERQQDRLVKAIRTDRGGEFVSKDHSLWLKKNGIRHSLTMPYSPAMNSIAERANRTITETARGLLIEAGLPEYFWPDAVRSACVASNRALTHVGADKWVPYVEWIGRKPKVDMLRVFGCMCMALVPKHLRHNKLGAKAIWAVHLGMAQNSKGWLLWDSFTKKFLVSRDCKFMENLMYKDWKAENEAKVGMRFGQVKSSGLEHVELPLELSSGSTTTRQSSLVNGGEEAKDAEEEKEEVQQVSERALTLPSRTTSAPRIRVTPQQRQGLHVNAAEEEGRGKRRTQAPYMLTYDALGKPAKSALAGAALMVGEDEESDYEECAFAFFSPVEMPGEPATLMEALESSDAEEWKKAMESELKSIEENGTWELVELTEGRKAITSKWLFKIKSDANGNIERYKSRLVAKGYQQKEKVDYKELFAPVVKGAVKEIGSCPTCLETKFTKFPFSSGTGPAKAPLALVHMDVVGPTRAPSLLGSRYFLTIVDDHTRAVWVNPLKTKGEVAAAVLKEWMPRAQRESGHKVKVVRTENGGEFIGADFEAVLKKKGIQHKLMVPYNPQQNGVAERFNLTLQEGTRTLLGRAGLPDPFWVTALRQVPPRTQRRPDRPRREVHPPNQLNYPSFGKPKVVRAGSVAEQCDEDEIAHCYKATVPEPKTLAEALSGPDAENWMQSVKEEYDSLLENEMHKYGPDGELTHYKSRLVAKGFQQTKGKDFDEIFALVGKGTTLRVMLGTATNRGWRIKQMDITIAFFNGIILEELYMLQPEGLDDGSGRVCRLKKDIYGQKQAPRAWYHKLEETLLAGGFKKSECDHSIFLLQEKEEFLMLLVYVDDILLFSESSAMIERVEEMLEMQFKCSKMGDVKYYLGMHVERDLDKGVLRLHQRKYCEGLAEKYGLQDGGKPATPLPSGFTVEPCADE
ncbi:unnamed protein product [Closterium sp. NIES-54]